MRDLPDPQMMAVITCLEQPHSYIAARRRAGCDGSPEAEQAGILQAKAPGNHRQSVHDLDTRFATGLDATRTRAVQPAMCRNCPLARWREIGDSLDLAAASLRDASHHVGIGRLEGPLRGAVAHVVSTASTLTDAGHQVNGISP